MSEIKARTTDGRTLFYELMEQYGHGTPIERAVRFFVLNRITFSGTVDSGGYSEQAFHGRFTWSAIYALRQVAPFLKGVQITWGDYEPVVREEGTGVFIFLDPPYYSVAQSRLYGRRGELHLQFDHERLARVPSSVHIAGSSLTTTRPTFARCMRATTRADGRASTA